MVVLAPRGAAATGWLALACALTLASGRPLSFSPATLGDDQARELWETKIEAERVGRPLEALLQTRRLLRAFPDNPRYLEAQAELLEKLSDWPAAAAAWELYFGVAPTPTSACPALGRAYEKIGAKDKALEAHERCAALDVTSGDLGFFLALALERAEKPEQARVAYERVLAVAPAYGDAAIGLARIELHAGAAAQALARLQALPPKIAQTPDAQVALGQTFLALNRKAEARAALEAALRIAPDYEDAKVLLQRAQP